MTFESGYVTVTGPCVQEVIWRMAADCNGTVFIVTPLLSIPRSHNTVTSLALSPRTANRENHSVSFGGSLVAFQARLVETLISLPSTVHLKGIC